MVLGINRALVLGFSFEAITRHETGERIRVDEADGHSNSSVQVPPSRRDPRPIAARGGR